MNDKMLDIIGLADEKYLREAQEQPAKKKTRRHRFSAGVVAAAVAAAMTLTAGAVAFTRFMHKDSVEYYYTKEMAEEMERKGYAVNQVTENEGVRMTLEYFMVSDVYATGVVTVECLKPWAEEAFRAVPPSYAFDETGKYIDFPNSNISSLFSLETRGDLNNDPKKQAYQLSIYIGDSDDVKSQELPDKVVIAFSEDAHYRENIDSLNTIDDLVKDDVFDGLTFEISLKPNMPQIELESASGHKAVLTEYSFDIDYNKGAVDFDDDSVPKEMVLHYTTGKSSTLESGYRTNPGFDPMAFAASGDVCKVKGRIIQQIDFEHIESVEFAGETYKVK